MIGQKIGEYKILQTLGEGGFGIVYKARSPNGTVVALKVLNKDALGNEKVVKKFFHEAMILARLDHPSITRLHEFFPDQDRYAIVMEFVEGVTLKEVVANEHGVIPFDQALNISRQILSAFEYAHTNGIIHRDIKPGNIMIDNRGVVKIMDFGIAKFSSEASSETRTTWKWGAPHYMSPERFKEDAEVDLRSDIYSLGVVFHEAFTGRRPFESSDTIRVIYAHMNEPPKNPGEYSSQIPKHVGKAILKALEKNPTKRFSSCQEFSQAMDGGKNLPDRPYLPVSPDDDTVIVEDEFTSSGDHTVAMAPPAGAIMSRPRTSRLASLLKNTYQARLTRYLIGLIILVSLMAASTLWQDDIWVFFGKVKKTAVTTLEKGRPGYERNEKGYWETTHPKDGARMVEVPGGEFTMGSDGYSDEKPVQRVNLSTFLLDKTPVTNSMFRKFIQETGYVTTAEKKGFGWVRKDGQWEKSPGAFWQKPENIRTLGIDKYELPVVQVSWEDAKAYCDWAGKNLPTEAQWEKAARGKNGNDFPWGNDPPNQALANFFAPDGALASVGAFGENSMSAYGVSDMAGNSYDWCADWYAPGVREYDNPGGPAQGTEKVVKGGSFVEGPESQRAAHRDHYAPDFSSNLFGFRCASKPLPAPQASVSNP